MFKKTLKFATLLLASTSLMGAATTNAFAGDTASEPKSFTEALSSGKVSGDMRFRFETVNQDGFSDIANASTLRTKLSYSTATFSGFSAKIEFENSINFEDQYNSTINGKTMYPVVADPKSTEVNQAYLAFTGLKNTTIVVGRQAVNLDNQRFVGTVGFRQNDQTFDAIAVINSSIPDVTAIYGYVWNVNRIFSDKHPFGNLATDTHILNLSYTGVKDLKISTYAYLVDLDHPAVQSLSAQTFGIRLAGNTDFSDNLNLTYTAEYANQSNYAGNPNAFSVNYLFAEAGVKVSGYTIKVAFESLGSDEGKYSFQTPLATLHKFNGWADKFLGTPTNGLNDFFITASYVVKSDESVLDGIKIAAIYHKFKSQTGGLNYGSEFDAVISKKINETFNVSFKYAKYSADKFGQDTRKFWMTVGMKF